MNNNFNNRQGGNQRPQNQNQYQNRQSVPPRGVPAPPVKHRSRKQARKAMAVTALVAVILVLLLISAVILLARCATGENVIGDGDSTIPAEDHGSDVMEVAPGVTVDTDGEQTPPVEEKKISDDDMEIEAAAADVHKGYQILINYANAFDFESGFVQDNVWAKNGRKFYPFDTNTHIERTTLNAFCRLTEDFYAESGNRDIIITSGWRDLESQQSAYDYYVDLYSEEYATMFAAQPGYSEHHTGLAMDLSIYGDGRTFENEKTYSDWFAENAYKYGFILRFPQDKKEITRIEYEYWHYRYVGVPHAYYIMKNNLCLEEYIDLLRGYDYFKPLTFTDPEGASWKIYYTAEDESGVTKVIVPKDGEYEISGNNVDGFIVTVQVNEAE